jgi:hypothetical protein
LKDHVQDHRNRTPSEQRAKDDPADAPAEKETFSESLKVHNLIRGKGKVKTGCVLTHEWQGVLQRGNSITLEHGYGAYASLDLARY